MADTFEQPNNIERDILDRALDAALAKYATADPRTGLEERVLANLQAQRGKAPDHARWRWSSAAVMAAVVVVAVALAWRSGRPSRPVIANHPSRTTQGPGARDQGPATQVASRALSNDEQSSGRPQATIVPAQARRSNPHRGHLNAAVVMTAGPKLDQFPSRLPVGVEEMALVRYVQSFPSDARLIAQAQEEFELETQKLMNDAGSQARTSDSVQQER